MKTLMKCFVLLVALATLATPTPLFAQTTGPYYYWWNVTDERGESFTGQNVQCSVYHPNRHAAAILHTTSTLATGGNSPLWSDAGGKIHFWASYNTPVDVTCAYAGGGTAQINKFRVTDHKIVLPRQAGMVISRFAVNDVSNTYQADSGLVLPGGAVVYDVIIQNLNPRGLGTYHLSVGFLGNHVVANAHALVAAQALTSPDEWLRPHLITFTALGAGDLAAAGSHRGVAMRRVHAANNAYYEMPYVVHLSSGLGVSYSSQVGTSAAVRAHVFILWRKYHTGADRFGLTN